MYSRKLGSSLDTVCLSNGAIYFERVSTIVKSTTTSSVSHRRVTGCSNSPHRGRECYWRLMQWVRSALPILPLVGYLLPASK